MKCDCGREAVKLCSDIIGIEGLVRCQKPICNSHGANVWCPEHRHEKNTMGYGDFKGSAEFEGFVPDGPGLANWLANLWRKLTYSPLRIAQYTWDRERGHCPPPAPFPRFELRVGYRYFKSDGPVMVEFFEDELDPRGLR